MNNMNEKKYTHVAAAKIAAAFLVEIYYEIKFTILKRKEKSKVSKLVVVTDNQTLALGAIVSEIDYNYQLDWWQSLLRTGICLEAKDIEHTLLSATDILTVLYDLIECVWAWVYDFYFVLIIIKKTKENYSHFLEATLLYEKVIKLISANPNNEDYNYYFCTIDVDYHLLPPHVELETLSLVKKQKIDEEIEHYLKLLKKNQ